MKGEERGGKERREEMARCLAGTLFFSFFFLLLFGITEYEITARISQIMPQNPSPI